ncbi:MAG: T9SS type A sorting domain-containing protein, partial [Bacteroidota bacterium]
SDDVVLITDMRGAMVLQSSLEKQSGLFTQTIAVDNLSTGIYNIRVIAGGKASDQRISIVK